MYIYIYSNEIDTFEYFWHVWTIQQKKTGQVLVAEHGHCGYPLVNVYIIHGKIIIFHAKIHELNGKTMPWIVTHSDYNSDSNSA